MRPRAKAEPGCARGASAHGLMTHRNHSVWVLIGTGCRHCCCLLRDGSRALDTAGWDRDGAAQFQSQDLSPSFPASRACSLPCQPPTGASVPSSPWRFSTSKNHPQTCPGLLLPRSFPRAQGHGHTEPGGGLAAASSSCSIHPLLGKSFPSFGS